jgi:DNA polymerase V
MNKHSASPVYIDVPVSAGFPSPAGDYLERSLDLNERLVPRPAATFFIRVRGDSMTGVGILDGDLLIVDRSCRPKSGDVVVAIVNGHFTVKLFVKTNEGAWLKAANPAYQPIALTADTDAEIWGVVTYAVHSFR